MQKLIEIGSWIAVLILLCVGARAQDPRVHEFARAIGRTEGFYLKGSIPNRLHNPGDLMTDARHQYPGQTGVYHHYAVFKNDASGWAALENQIQKVIDGTSTKYTQDMSMVQIARVYAENWRYWSRTVCKILRVDPRMTFQEYFGLAPRVKVTYAIPVWLQRRGDAVLPMLEVQPMPPQVHREARWFSVEEVSDWTTGEAE